MNKSRTNYWVDVLIATAFVVSAVSGIIFLLPVRENGALGISYQVWDRLHQWGGLVMTAGVLAHLILHWKWILHMTKKSFLTGKAAAARPVVQTAEPVAPLKPAAGPSFDRREFLQMAGAGALVTTAGLLGFKLLTDNVLASDETTSEPAVTDDGVTDSTSIPLTVQQSRTACPKGLVNDPYPGRCHHYVDRDGDGYCDYSVV